MNEQKSTTILLLLFVQIGVLLASTLPESDNTLNDLYENLLQREYMGPIGYPNHQVERKAQRSPSLRLRFGRRSDPGLIPLQVKRFSDQINRKPIRSPSLRLRFGKRNPMEPILDDNYLSNYQFYRDIRKPYIARLRWGKRDSDDNDLITNYLRQLAFDSVLDDDNDKTVAELNEQKLQQQEQQQQQQQKQQQARVSVPAYNLNGGDGVDMNAADLTDEQKRAPTNMRLRWGRSYNPNAAPLTSSNGIENGTGTQLEENSNVGDQPSDN